MFIRCLRRAVAIALLFAAAALTHAEDAPDQVFVSRQDGFSVEIPGTVIQFNYRYETHDNTLYVSNSTSVHYLVVCYTKKTKAKLTHKDPQQVLKRARERHHRGAEFADDRVLSHGSRKLPGREYTVIEELTKGAGPRRIREQMFLDGNRVFTLRASPVGAVLPETDEVRWFFSSFRIAD